MKIHFIGIGGIGISALARYHLGIGDEVSGSDLSSSEITEVLQSEGATIYYDHRTENISDDVQLVIHTVAVPESNPEMIKSKELEIEVLTYPQALGRLTEKYDTIAVCGAHGKGTTTALLSLSLIEAELDPSVVIGTTLKEFNNSNLRVGQSKYFVIEADEYRRAFLNYRPKYVLLTNIDKEHLDCYRDLEDIKSTFKEFISYLPQDGALIANVDDENVRDILEAIEDKRVVTYSLDDDLAESLRGRLSVPGKHNLSNALGALKMSMELGVDKETAVAGLSKYQGAWRRFEVFEKGGLAVISDYAHHPSEVRATIQATKERFPERRLIAVFQPHHYQRTHALFDEFVSCFDGPDKLFITDIFDVAGRENDETRSKVNSQMLAEAVGSAEYVSREDTLSILKEEIQEGDVVLIMGAGDIYKVVAPLVE